MKNNLYKIIAFLVIVIVCTLTLGYSAFGSEMSISNIVADVRIASDVRVTGVSMSSSSNGTVNSIEYDVDSIFGNINLNDFNATVTLMVSITNFGNEEMGIWDITGLTDNLYKSINSYELKTKLCDSSGNCSLGSITNFYITIGYDSYDAITKNHDIKLDFEFRKMHQVTYTGITNNGYPTSVIDGGNLTFTATRNIPPKIIVFDSNNNRMDYDLYSYLNNTFNFDNVTSDIVLKYQAKAYMASLSSDTYFKESAYKTVIDSIQFVDYVDTSNAVKVYDLSATSGSKDVMGWITSGNDLYIGSDWEIYSKSLQAIFFGMSSVKTISFGNLNTSEATTMYSMFNGCSSLSSLDVSTFDTGNVVDMGHMFNGLKLVSTIDVSGFDTSNVYKFSNMFYNMSSLTSLDVSNFDTSAGTLMYGMFAELHSLTSLDLSNFDTSKVTRMDSMFSNCQNLANLNINSFNTSLVTNMSNMFMNNYVLTSLDVSKFNTSNVTKMSGMFSGVKSVTYLDVSGFDTRNVTSMQEMFFLMENVAAINVSGFNTDKVTGYGMYGMFSCMKKIKSLDLSNFNTSGITIMDYMFNSCRSLESLDVSSFDTSNVTSMAGMFAGNHKLKSLNVSSFDTSKVTRMDNMFEGSALLTSLDLSNFDTAAVNNFTNMFLNSGIKNLYFNRMSFSSATKYMDMFSGVSSSISIVVGDLTTKNWIQERLGEGVGTVTIASA